MAETDWKEESPADTVALLLTPGGTTMIGVNGVGTTTSGYTSGRIWSEREPVYPPSCNQTRERTQKEGEGVQGGIEVSGVQRKISKHTSLSPTTHSATLAPVESWMTNDLPRIESIPFS